MFIFINIYIATNNKLKINVDGNRLDDFDEILRTNSETLGFYTDFIKKYGVHKDYVLSVSPGLSGMWQISGRSETSYDERIYYDTYYIQNWSVWLDIWILIKIHNLLL